MKKHILLLFLLVGTSLTGKAQSTDNVDLMFPNLMMTRYHYDNPACASQAYRVLSPDHPAIAEPDTFVF